MATTNTAELTEAMKVLFEDSLEENVVTESEILDLFEADNNVKEETTGGGRYIETAQLFQLPSGYGYRTENDYIPVPEGPVVRNTKIMLKKAMGAVEMTGDVMEKVTRRNGGKEAFVDWSQRSIPYLVERMKNEDDRIALGFGAGVKARVAAVPLAPSTTLTLTAAQGVTGYNGAWMQFLEGEMVAFGPNVNGTGLRAGRAKVTRVAEGTHGSITVNAIPAGVAANDYIFSADAVGVGSQDATGANREFMGLLGHVDDGGIIANYFGINRADFRQWGAVVLNAAAAPYNAAPYNSEFNEALILKGDQIARTSGGAKINAIIAPESGAFNFWLSLKNDRAINDPRAYTGGRGRLKMLLIDRLVEIRAARKLPSQVAFGLTTGGFRRYTLGKFEWNTRTGSMWKQGGDATGRLDSFWAYGSKYCEIVTTQPRKNIRFEGLVG